MFWGFMKQPFPSKCPSCHRVPGPLGWLDQAQGSFSCTGETPPGDRQSRLHSWGPRAHPGSCAGFLDSRPPKATFSLLCPPPFPREMLQDPDADPSRVQTWPGESPDEKVAERRQPQRPPAGNPDSCLGRRTWALGPDPRLAVAVSGVQRSWGR